MRTILLLAMAAESLGSAATYAVQRALEMAPSGVTFVVGAILGTQVGVFLTHRHLRRAAGAEARPTLPRMGTRLALGLALAAGTAALGAALQAVFHPFPLPDVMVCISAAGSGVFPLILFGTFWKSLDRAAHP